MNNIYAVNNAVNNNEGKKKKSEMKVIGVDAGGTKTRAAAFDEAGNVVAEAVRGCGNLALSYEAAHHEISDAIRAVFDSCAYAYIAVGAAGAGAGDSGVAKRLSDDLSQEFGVKTDVMTDAELALTSAFGIHGDGMLVISGTGSAVFLRRGGQIYRAGGWGHLIGDGGSAYFTGITAVRAITSCRDIGSPDEALEAAVFRAIGIGGIADLTAYIYSPDRTKSDIAKIAPSIDSLAELGCPSAVEILKKSADSISGDAAAVISRAGTSEVKIALTGGHIRNSKLLRRRFLESLQDRLRGCDIQIMENEPDPAYAAVRLFWED